MQAPELLAEAPRLQDTLALGHLVPEGEIVAVGVGSRRVPPHGHARGAIVKGARHADDYLPVECEFDEMPSLRVTLNQARRLFGVPEPASSWVLQCLISEGFLMCTPRGEYMRRA